MADTLFCVIFVSAVFDGGTDEHDEVYVEVPKDVDRDRGEAGGGAGDCK